MTIFYDQSKPIEKIGIVSLRKKDYIIFSTVDSVADEKRLFLFDLKTEKIFYLCRINEYEKIEIFI